MVTISKLIKNLNAASFVYLIDIGDSFIYYNTFIQQFIFRSKTKKIKISLSAYFIDTSHFFSFFL